MKRLLIIAIAALTMSGCAPTPDPENIQLANRIEILEHKTALRELVDTFSNLADVKDAQGQTLLFTENALVETYREGASVSRLEGRLQIGEAFGRFLSNFKTVYHMNGQQTVTINGDTATGTLYCLTTLITADQTKTIIGVKYNDDYVLVDGKWLIAKRTSFFEWQEVTKIEQ